jgi:hypothetical protein
MSETPKSEIMLYQTEDNRTRIEAEATADKPDREVICADA